MSTTTIPQTATELEDFISDPVKIKDAVEKNEFAGIIKGYVNAVAEKDREQNAQMREQIQLVVSEMLKDNGQKVERIDLSPKAKAASKAAAPALYNNPRANGAPLDGLFDSRYDFFQALWSGNTPSDEVAEKLKQVRAYSEKIPSEGGLLVPEEFRTELMMLSLGTSIVRPLATVLPMGSPRLNIPSVDETSRVSSVFGGVVVYRTEEAAALVASSAKFASTKLDVTKQTARADVPNELVRDWGAFGAFIDQTIPAAIGFYEDLDFLSGSGVGEPLGALNSANPAIIEVAKEGAQLAATIVWENIIKMYARMLPSSLPSAVWVATPEAFVELATMALSVGTGGAAVWLPDGTGAPTLTLLGRPVIMTEKAPAVLGTRGDLSFVDFSQYLIGDYQTMSMDFSEHVRFTTDETVFRAIARNDGRPWMKSAITPQNGGPTLSPYVQLATRA